MTIFFLKVKPNAKIEKIEKIDDTHLKVWVKELPIRGRANAAVIRAVAEYVGVSPTQIKIVAGHTARNKAIEILKLEKNSDV